MKRIILFLLSFLIVSFLCAQSHVVSGKVVDFDNGNPLSGVSVLEQDTQNGVISDIDGQFSILVHDGACLEISHVGFLPMTIKTGDKEDIGIVRMCFYSTILTDVNVVSQLVVQRETPIAMTPVPADIIENRLGSQEFPELLNHTPSVHANKQGGGWGDAEVYMRGFDNSNVAVMINGIPMNDMENGTVYWSNWTCLSDITAELQSQRGIGACKLSTPSIGGTINIVTKGIDVVIALIVGGIVILKAFSSGPKVDLKKVYDDCDLMWPWANCGSDGSYIAIDTNPYDVDDGDYTYSSTAFSAVKRVNDELGLPSYLINEMSRVNALQGRQTEKFEDAGIEVSYSYHPDHGLEVTYKLIK